MGSMAEEKWNDFIEAFGALHTQILEACQHEVPENSNQHVYTALILLARKVQTEAAEDILRCLDTHAVRLKHISDLLRTTLEGNHDHLTDFLLASDTSGISEEFMLSPNRNN